MKPKLILGLALVLSSCSMEQSQKAPAEAVWQTTLRGAVTNGNVFPPFMAGGIYFYAVPAEAAKILEGEPSAELLPFLKKLQAETPAWKAGIVDPWIMIVHQGLHGTPSVITNSITSPKGDVTEMEIPVYTYSIHLVKPNSNQP